jgi:hypothetical protein
MFESSFSYGSRELIRDLLGMHEADMKPLASNEGQEVLPLVLQNSTSYNKPKTPCCVLFQHKDSTLRRRVQFHELFMLRYANTLHIMCRKP